MKKVNLSDKGFIFLMLLPALAMIAIFTYYPIGRGITMAFQEYNLMNLNNIHWIGLDNFKELFSFSPYNTFYNTIANTVWWVIISLFFQFIIGFGIALLLKKKFVGQGIYKGLIFFPWAVSGFIIGIMWRWLFNGTSGVINDILVRIGILSQPFGFLSTEGYALGSVIVANIWYGIPFFIIMIAAALSGVPDELNEAAAVDGATKWQRFWNVTLPFIKPVIVLTLLLRAIWIFNFPELIYAMTNGGPAGSSRIITSYMMEKIQALDYGMGAAVGVVVMIILIIFTLLYLALTKFEDMGDEL